MAATEGRNRTDHSVRRRSWRVCWSALAAAIVLGCSSPTAVQSTVQFSLDAPFCSSVIPAQFYIDDVLVGTDTFRVHLTPEHLMSRSFTVAPGTHTLGARVGFLGVVGFSPWPATADTVVAVGAGASVTRVLPFYCS